MPRKPPTLGQLLNPHAKKLRDKAYDLTRRRRDPGLLQAKTIRDSAGWKRFRTWFKARHPLCCDPFGVHGDRPTPMEHPHHIEPLQRRPDLAMCESNNAPLCASCHARVEQMERAGKPTAQLFAAYQRTIEDGEVWR